MVSFDPFSETAILYKLFLFTYERWYLIFEWDVCMHFGLEP